MGGTMEDHLEMVKEMHRLSQENEEIKRNLDTTKGLLNDLQKTVLLSGRPKGKRNIRSNPRQEFYKQHRHDNDILKVVRDDLDVMGYKSIKTLPYQMIKHHTDRKFDTALASQETSDKGDGESKQDVGAQSTLDEGRM